MQNAIRIGVLSVKTFNISPESTSQNRTEQSIEEVMSWSSLASKLMEVIALVCPTILE
jgi:hypothetical protein